MICDYICLEDKVRWALDGPDNIFIPLPVNECVLSEIVNIIIIAKIPTIESAIIGIF